MKKLVIIGMACVVLAGAFAYGSYELYQHHLSGDLKRLLVAANDPHDSFSELEAYLHQMRPLVRTRMDRDLFDRFERGIFLVRDSQETSDRWFNKSMTEIQSLRTDGGDACAKNVLGLQKAADHYRAQGRPVPADIAAELAQASLDVKTCRDRKQAELQEMEKVSEDQLQQGKQLMAQVRRDLDLPAVEAPPQVPSVAQASPPLATTTPLPVSSQVTRPQQDTVPEPVPRPAPVPVRTPPPVAIQAQGTNPVEHAPAAPIPPPATVVAPQPLQRAVVVEKPSDALTQPAKPVRRVLASPAGDADTESRSTRPRPSTPTGAADCPGVRSGDFERTPAGWQFCVTNGACLSLPDTRRCFH